jgi:hypothetical protein
MDKFKEAKAPVGAPIVQQEPFPQQRARAFFTEHQLAERWQVSLKKLQADRIKGDGCPFIRVGRCIRYRLTDVLHYEDSRLRRSTTESSEFG